jgi:hypothetical protein
LRNPCMPFCSPKAARRNRMTLFGHPIGRIYGKISDRPTPEGSTRLNP